MDPETSVNLAFFLPVQKAIFPKFVVFLIYFVCRIIGNMPPNEKWEVLPPLISFSSAWVFLSLSLYLSLFLSLSLSLSLSLALCGRRSHVPFPERRLRCCYPMSSFMIIVERGEERCKTKAPPPHARHTPPPQHDHDHEYLG